MSWVVPPTFGWLVASKNKHLRKTLDKKEAGTVICSSEYDLDPAGMRLGRTLSDGKYDAWSYDPNYQLRTESRWSAKTPGSQTYRKEFDYDGNGNRTAEYADGVKTATTVGDNNQLTAVGEFDIMTDFMGNTIDISDGVTDEFFEYNWERNLIIAYLDESQSDTHEYDGDGRRMRSRLNSASNWTHFVHDELTEQVLGEFTLVSTTFTLKAANTYGWGLISSNRESTKRYFHFDGLGNTLCLTDTSETTQDSYAYTAFGTTLSSSGSSVNPYRYVGQWGYYDDGAMGSPHDFVLCGARYYAPRFGRFLTWDPIGTRGYGYCDNAVTAEIDPTGRAQDEFHFGGGLDELLVSPPRESGTSLLCKLLCANLICAGMPAIAKRACTAACVRALCGPFAGGSRRRFYEKCWEKSSDECDACCEDVCSDLVKAAQGLCLRNCKSGCDPMAFLLCLFCFGAVLCNWGCAAPSPRPLDQSTVSDLLKDPLAVRGAAFFTPNVCQVELTLKVKDGPKALLARAKSVRLGEASPVLLGKTVSWFGPRSTAVITFAESPGGRFCVMRVTFNKQSEAGDVYSIDLTGLLAGGYVTGVPFELDGADPSPMIQVALPAPSADIAKQLNTSTRFLPLQQ